VISKRPYNFSSSIIIAFVFLNLFQDHGAISGVLQYSLRAVLLPPRGAASNLYGKMAHYECNNILNLVKDFLTDVV